MNLGLKKGIVQLSDYNSLWTDEFEKEKSILQEALGDYVLEIEHIGSTAIPGMKAKPIIDILLATNSLDDVDSFSPFLNDLGYVYRENASDEVHLVFAKGFEESRTHYLHIATLNSLIWKNDRYFRDTLQNDAELAKEYEDLKISLANQYSDDRTKYTEGKKVFIEKVLNS